MITWTSFNAIGYKSHASFHMMFERMDVSSIVDCTSKFMKSLKLFEFYSICQWIQSDYFIVCPNCWNPKWRVWSGKKKKKKNKAQTLQMWCIRCMWFITDGFAVAEPIKLVKNLIRLKTLSCEIIFKYCGRRIKHNNLFVTFVNYSMHFSTENKQKIKWNKNTLLIQMLCMDGFVVVCIILFLKHDCSVRRTTELTSVKPMGFDAFAFSNKCFGFNFIIPLYRGYKLLRHSHSLDDNNEQSVKFDEKLRFRLIYIS